MPPYSVFFKFPLLLNCSFSIDRRLSDHKSEEKLLMLPAGKSQNHY